MTTMETVDGSSKLLSLAGDGRKYIDRCVQC